MMLSRRAAIGTLMGASIAGTGVSLAQDGTGDGDLNLGRLAAEIGILFGAAIDVEVVRVPAAADLYRSQCRIFTVDHSMKFLSLRPTRDTFAFESSDQILRFADAAGTPLRAHTLIWNDWTP